MSRQGILTREGSRLNGRVGEGMQMVYVTAVSITIRNGGVLAASVGVLGGQQFPLNEKVAYFPGNIDASSASISRFPAWFSPGSWLGGGESSARI